MVAMQAILMAKRLPPIFKTINPVKNTMSAPNKVGNSRVANKLSPNICTVSQEIPATKGGTSLKPQSKCSPSAMYSNSSRWKPKLELARK